jgi:putative ABC transport system permease protein
MSSFFQNLRQDLRFAFRNLGKSPSFLAVVILSLALGIGANSTIFSVLDAALFRPLPYPHPEQLVVIWDTEPGKPESRQNPPIAELSDWLAANHSFQDIALTSDSEDSMMAGIGAAQQIDIQNVTPNYFSLIGTKPQMGRVFFAEEMQDKSISVVLSDGFWRMKFNADPNVLGKAFDVQGSVATVVGVMPHGLGGVDGEKIDMWLPIDSKSSRFADRIDHWLVAVGRLKPGVTIQQAQSEMNVIAQGLATAYPKTNTGVGEKLQPLRYVLSFGEDYLYQLLCAVAFVLLIGCLNVANLLQSRTESRRREYALRLTLGAERGRLMQQTMIESGVLAALGCLAGIAITFVGVRIFIAMSNDSDFFARRIHLDWRVLGFTVAISALTAFIFGIVPAWQASRTDPNAVLRESERGSVGKSRGMVRQSLVVVEIALAMVLLVGAGLMINTVMRLKTVDLGFDPSNILTGYVNLPEGGKYVQRLPRDVEKWTPSVDSFYRQLTEKFSAIPGVEAVALARSAPTGVRHVFTFTVEGRPAPSENERPESGFDGVSPGYFDLLHIPLRKGRAIDDHDIASAPWVAVVNEAMAKKFFPNEDPIGKQIRLRFDPYPIDEDRPRQIVGVVGDVKNRGLSRETFPTVYVSSLQEQSVMPGGTILIHTDQTIMLKLKSGDKGLESQVIAAMRQGAAEVDPDVPFIAPDTLPDLVERHYGEFQFGRNLLAIFAGIALLLAVIGIYGVMSYFVNARTHEIGVRVALGALPRNILALIGGLGLKLSAIGVALGASLALALTRFISASLYGVKPTDPLTYVLVAITLIAVALLACFIPARRAVTVDPVIALRHE